MKENVQFRLATEQDLDKIVAMLADDVLGKKRERYEEPLPDSYLKAFQAISSDPNNELIVACRGKEIIGVQQITFTPYITHQGGWRASENCFFCKRGRDWFQVDRLGDSPGKGPRLSPDSTDIR